MVFCGLFPVDAAEFEDLREAMARLRLNDASFSYETETSAALGFGFRCGFLGLLHLEIITERLEREFNLELITTAPSVIYHIYLTDGSMIEMHNPADMPEPSKIDRIEEPWIEATILVPDEHLGAVLKLCQDRRGAAEEPHLRRLARHAGLRAAAERGGVRLLRPAEIDQPRLRLVRLPDQGLRAGRPREDVDPGQRRAGRRALHDRAPRARREPRPRHVREAEGADPAAPVPDPDPGGDRRHASSRARPSGRCARTCIAKCYGGDITRKRKLLEKQKKGKKKMRQFGQVEIPQEAFIAALKMDEN